jgi:NAD(P)H-hydrate epimerase
MTGAAHLAAAAALRAGAGMVHVGSPGVRDDVARPTEAVGIPLAAAGWAQPVLGAAPRFGASVIGPGLGRGDETTEAAREVIAAVPLPVVVDGDGLVALGAGAAELLSGRTEATILTPHAGELAHLLGSEPGADRMATARDLAAATGAIVLAKGPTTVVAAPDGRVRVVTDGDARLATAGTGDVLSGIVGALLARGVEPFAAAAAGAWLHARAGASGPSEGLVASDVVERIPAALAEAR